MGILADNLELIEKTESEEERAKPEKCLPLRCVIRKRRQQCKDSRKDGAKSVWR